MPTLRRTSTSIFPAGTGELSSISGHPITRLPGLGAIYAAIRQGEASEGRSPNNRISERSNETRVGGRIPDIYGSVRSTPDVIFPPYIIGGFEIAMYCIGKGAYDVAEVMDGNLLINGSEDSSYEIYGPFKSPNNSEPDVLVGPAITNQLGSVNTIFSDDETNPLQRTTRASSILVGFTVEGEGPAVGISVIFTRLTDQATTSIDDFYEVGTHDLNLTNPYVGIETSVSLRRFSEPRQVVEEIPLEEWIQRGFGEQTYPDPPPTRVTGEVIEQSLTSVVVNEVVPFTQPHFGNVTTIYTRTRAHIEEGEETISDRELSCQVSRLIPRLAADGQFAPNGPFPTSDAASVLVSICTDEFIGRQSLDQLDLVNFRETINEVATYFGDSRLTQFNYTFDDSSLSFEETIAIVAEAVFCTAYREGSKIKLFFERDNATSSLLISDDNRLPDSERRRISFGVERDYDGVELEYFDSEGNSQFIYVPADQSATNPNKITRLGVKRRLQAYMHANREYNKLIYTNTFLSSNCTQEVAALANNDKVLVADGTNSTTMSGVILNTVGNVLTLDPMPDLQLGVNYSIFIQDVSGVVVSRPITLFSNNMVEVTDLTGVVMSLDPNNYVQSLFKIKEVDSNEISEFLVQSKRVNDNLSVTLEMINYDARYYANDQDFRNSTNPGEFNDVLAGNSSDSPTAPFFRTLRPGDLIWYADYTENYPGIPEEDLQLNASAFDVNGDAVTYSISGPDAHLFTIGNSGRVHWITNPRFNNPQDANGDNFYIFTVTVTDGALTRSAPVTVGVVNDRQNIIPNPTRTSRAPFFTNATNGQVVNIDEGTDIVFFSLQAFDINGDTFTFSMLPFGDHSEFNFTPTGDLSFIAAPDYDLPTDLDTNNRYELMFRVTDSNGLTRDVDLTINVTEVI